MKWLTLAKLTCTEAEVMSSKEPSFGALGYFWKLFYFTCCLSYLRLDFLWSALSPSKWQPINEAKKVEGMNNKKATYLSKHSQWVLGLQENVIKKIAFLRTHNSPRETRLQSNPISRQELNQPLSVFIRLFSTTNQFRRIPFLQSIAFLWMAIIVVFLSPPFL